MEATLDLVSTCTTFLLVLKDNILNFVVVLAGKFHLLKSVKTLLETFWLCVLLEVIYLMNCTPMMLVNSTQFLIVVMKVNVINQNLLCASTLEVGRPLTLETLPPIALHANRKHLTRFAVFRGSLVSKDKTGTLFVMRLLTKYLTVVFALVPVPN